MSLNEIINNSSIIGVGLFAGSFVILQVFKDPAKKFTDIETKKIIESGEIMKLADMVMDQDFDPKLIREFYEKSKKINQPVQDTKSAFSFCLFSGICLILSALLGVLNLPFLVSFQFALFLYGILFIFFSLFYIIRLLPVLF